MKWWFSSWNLFLFSLSKVCRISSANCFISGFTASQSTLFCKAKYSVLHFASTVLFFLLFYNKVFLLLRRAVTIIIFHKIYLLFDFYSLTIIGKLRAVCRGISRKFYKKLPRIFSRQPHIKRKSDIIQTSFYFFGYFVKSFLTHLSHVQYVI